MITPNDVTQILAALTIFAQVISVGLILGLITGHSKKLILHYKLEHKHFLIGSYLVSLIATLGSLYYSDVAGYTPCKLCWYQRILMYPQTILYLIALVKDDKNIGHYALGLSGVGAVLAAYHYLLQIGVLTTTACSAVGFSVSCSENFGTTFGYITIPMMALASFGLIIMLWVTWFQSQKKSQ